MGRRNFEQRHVTYKRVVEPMCRRRDADVEELSAVDKISSVKFAFGVSSFLFVFIILYKNRENYSKKKTRVRITFSTVLPSPSLPIHYFAQHSTPPLHLILCILDCDFGFWYFRAHPKTVCSSRPIDLQRRQKVEMTNSYPIVFNYH